MGDKLKFSKQVVDLASQSCRGRKGMKREKWTVLLNKRRVCVCVCVREEGSLGSRNKKQRRKEHKT
jgi:hypothetical protein